MHESAALNDNIEEEENRLVTSKLYLCKLIYLRVTTVFAGTIFGSSRLLIFGGLELNPGINKLIMKSLRPKR